MIRRATLVSALATVAFLGSRAQPDGAPRPAPPDTPAAKEAQVRAVCSQCHRFPPPDILPRDAWKRTVAQMKGFVLEGVGAPVPGPLVEDFDLAPFVDYYESRAPAALPPPEPWPPPGDDAARFVRHAIRGSGAEPLVANVTIADLDGEGRPRIVASEMAGGLGLVADPRSAEPRLAPVALVPHPCHAEAVDLDRDGRTDLLVADLGTTAASDDQAGSVVWLRREAGGGFRAVTLARRLPRVADVQAADFDGDGDLDLVVAAFGWRWIGAVYLFENRTADWDRPVFVRREIDSRKGAVHVQEAPGRFARHTLERGGRHVSLDVADVDGDGDVDVVVGNFQGAGDVAVEVWENRGRAGRR